jgi:hypothetical protein
MGIVRWRDWLPQTVIIIVILALLVLSALAAEAPALAVVPTTDYMGISTAIIAVGTLISTVLGAIAILINALSASRIKQAEANSLLATAAANAAEKTAKATEIKVDGSLTKFLDMIKDGTIVQGELIRESATASAILAEKAAQRDREQVASSAAALTAAAVAASRGTRASETRLGESGGNITPVLNVLAVAEEAAKKLRDDGEAQAKRLREDAEDAARRLLAEAHRVSVTNTEPIPMKIVQEQGDQPIRTKVVQDVVEDPLEGKGT